MVESVGKREDCLQIECNFVVVVAVVLTCAICATL